MFDVAGLIDKVNFRIPFGRWQLFELTDLWIVPPFIKHDAQDALAARWATRIPRLQPQSPAELAADIVNDSLQSLPDLDSNPWSVIDFGSGNGGPVQTMDMLVNHGRKASGQTPISFVLTDLHPNLNLDAWMRQSANSGSLSFVPNAVDAANPTYSVISSTTKGYQEGAAKAGLEPNRKKVFRLFCAAFHHFDDEMAVRALKSTLETSDAFAIVELRERTVFSFLLVLIENLVLMLMAIVWFWNDPVHLLFTYGLPVLPITQCVDGFVASLRMRSFDEFLELLQKAQGEEAVDLRRDASVAYLGHWEIKHVRVRHTWPIGYMNVIVGTSRPCKPI